MRLMLVEDDLALGQSLKTDLEYAAFTVDWVRDGKTAEFQGATEPYDMVVLDLGLPVMNGLEVLRHWRQAGNKVPVLILTARDAWHERVDGFKAGADDYLGKPFHAEELLARVQAIIKRSHGLPPTVMKVAGLDLDEERQTVVIEGGQPLQLSAMEFRILQALMLHPGKVVSKGHLIEHIYGINGDPDSNVVEVYIAKLRGKIGSRRISTRRGQGYVLELNP
jgi:two-component system OmpR family response regulator